MIERVKISLMSDSSVAELGCVATAYSSADEALDFLVGVSEDGKMNHEFVPISSDFNPQMSYISPNLEKGTDLEAQKEE